MSDNTKNTTSIFTVKELAAVLKVSSRSVQRWIKAGKLPKPSRLGQCGFWTLDQLLPFLNNRVGI